MDDFLKGSKQDRLIMMVRGYAGTGKTSVINALVNTLPQFNHHFVLMAPTGRAAKVMSAYANRLAFTIHKRIYKKSAHPETGAVRFARQRNYAKNTVFIVDEASMLSEASGFGKTGLLTDLIDYIFQDQSNKLLLIGDGAQLPPVGQDTSVGLDETYLSHQFRAKVISVNLTEVMRQSLDSGILYNATSLRGLLQQQKPDIHFVTKGFTDTYKMNGDKMEDGLRYAYDKYGVENVIVICRSNKSANQYNQYIRMQIHFCQEELEAGDLLMVVRNNYFHVPEGTPGGFIANGDFAEIRKVMNFEEMHGFRFVTLQLAMADYPDREPFEAKVMLDTLSSTSTSLSTEDNQKLYASVLLDYQELSTKKERNEALKNDPYLNALQVKFAYALTCHKSQGGQWKAVFVDQGYLTDELLDTGYIRWLYTAITRATDELFLVNFRPQFFVNNEN